MNSTAIEHYTHLSFDAMGSRFEMMIDIQRSSHSVSDGQAIAEEMRELVLDWHNRLSVFHPGSIVSRFNRVPIGIPFSLDADLYVLCNLSDQIRIRTQGVFNIASGSLMQAYGFRNESHQNHDMSSVDLNAGITLDEQNQTITRNHEAVSLDFGAIAKGFVLDLIRDELVGYDVENAFIHGGTSSILAMGTSHTDSPWMTRIGEYADASLKNISMGVSSQSSRTIKHGDETVGHVMDPTTLAPAKSEIELAACIHNSAAIADAYSTVCSIRPELIPRLNEEDCSIIAYPSESPHSSDSSKASSQSHEPFIHDPLGVIELQQKATL